MKEKLRALSIAVYAVLAVTGASAILYCLHCIFMGIHDLQEMNKNPGRDLDAIASLITRPLTLFFLVLLLVVIGLLIIEAVILWKKLRKALSEETYTLYWKYTVSEFITLLINGAIFFMISPLAAEYADASDARITAEIAVWFLIFLASAICALIALVISFKEKRYE